MKQLAFTKYFGVLGLGLSLVALRSSAEEIGAVYTMDNAAAGNHVLAFGRDQSGALTAAGSFATGGNGTGAGLSSQGSVLLSADGQWLLVCNAGSSEISVFAVGSNGLTWSSKVSSGGLRPVSLALHDDLLYVLNAGGSVGDSDNITAFTFGGGQLAPLPNSTRSLSASNTTPGQVSFAGDGGVLVVTEEKTSVLDTFVVGSDGLASDHKTFQSIGLTPFGFNTGRGNRIFVSNAGGGVANGSSASSYEISPEGDLSVISGAVPTEQSAACWLTVSRNGRFAYTGNAGSGSISGFSIGPNGSLHLLNADGKTAVTGSGSHPIDMVASSDGRFLYSLANGNGTLNPFRVQADGSLQPETAVTGLPASSAGLAGR